MKGTDGYVQENTGLNLLKKGRRGLSRMLFSRAGLLAVMILCLLKFSLWRRNRE